MFINIVILAYQAGYSTKEILEPTTQIDKKAEKWDHYNWKGSWYEIRSLGYK